MKAFSPVPRVSDQTLISHDKVNQITELRQISMQGHSLVPRASDQPVISHDEVKNNELLLK